MDQILENLEFFVSYDLKDYEILFKEIDFEFTEMFERVIVSWCSKSSFGVPPLWEVYLARQNHKGKQETIGLTGLYKLDDTPSDFIRLGWTGVRRQFMRMGLGREMIEKMKARAKDLNYKFLCVHTERENQAAISFYKSSGFEEIRDSKLIKKLIFDPIDVALVCEL